MSDEDEISKEIRRLQELQEKQRILNEKRRTSGEKRRSPREKQNDFKQEGPSSSSRGSDLATPSTSSKKSRNDNYNLERKQQLESEDDSEEDANWLMSEVHKKILQENRPILVQNLTPDDIFNILLSKKVMSTSEVDRIQKNIGRETIIEELLNTLVRKPDRAFGIFVEGLRTTCQEHLANILQSPQKKKTQNPPKLHVRAVVDDFQRDRRYNNDEPACSLEEIDKHVLAIARNAFANIRRRNNSPAAFEQWRKELKESNILLKETVETANTVKLFCDNGRQLEDISYGSVCFQIRFHTLDGLQELWNMYISGALLDCLQKGLVTKELKQKYHLKTIQLQVIISKEEYQACVEELRALDINGSESTKFEQTTRCTTKSTTKSKSSCRVAFKEIHHNVSSPNHEKKPSMQPKKIRSVSTRENSCRFELRSKTIHIRTLPNNHWK